MKNLVPRPRPELWQDAPESPLGALKSPQAQGRLAVCQLISSMDESRSNFGVATYASSTGDANFRRPTEVLPPDNEVRSPPTIICALLSNASVGAWRSLPAQSRLASTRRVAGFLSARRRRAVGEPRRGVAPE